MQIRKFLPILVLIIMVTAAGTWLALRMQSEQGRTQQVTTIKNGVVLSPPRKIGIPALIKDDGSAFSMDDLTGHWSLMFFGYTNCPDVCPTTMGVLQQALKRARKMGRTFPKVFFVSVDPERDKPEMLAEYLNYFDPSFVGVTGDAKMIDALARQMSVAYRRVENPSGNPNDYLMDHSSALMLLDPQGRLAAFLTAPHTPQGILDSVRSVTGQAF